jgi:hypothetical protein
MLSVDADDTPKRFVLGRRVTVSATITRNRVTLPPVPDGLWPG